MIQLNEVQLDNRITHLAIVGQLDVAGLHAIDIKFQPAVLLAGVLPRRLAGEEAGGQTAAADRGRPAGGYVGLCDAGGA